MILGGVIACRVYTQNISDSRKKYFMAFGGLIVFSGALCFVLEQNWFMHLGVYVKVPLYGILGISISYALTFAIVDLVNYLSSYVPYFTRTPVDNSEQILAVMGFSVLM